jgi:hypothetical protein
MHGGPLQYCSDHFHEDFYRVSPLFDPVGVAYGFRAMRGGGLSGRRSGARGSDAGETDAPSSFRGFRVVYELPPDDKASENSALSGEPESESSETPARPTEATEPEADKAPETKEKPTAGGDSGKTEP